MLNRMKFSRIAYILASTLTISSMILCLTTCKKHRAKLVHSRQCMTAQLAAVHMTLAVLSDNSTKHRFATCIPTISQFTDGATSAVPLTLRDSNGNPVSGVVNFGGYYLCPSRLAAMVSWTALRQEGLNEIGHLVHATIDGQIAANTCIVRVLGQDYDLSFNEIVGENTVLYYPAAIDGEDIEAYVQQY